jgi:predicted outer membrane protein
MAEFFNVSVFQLRQIDKFNDLPRELQKVVLDNDLGIEISYQLWRLPKETQIEAGKASSGLKSHEVREFVRLLLTDPKASVKETKKIIEQKRKEKINVLMLPLTLPTFQKLQDLASKSQTNTHDLALKILEEYLDARK